MEFVTGRIKHVMEPNTVSHPVPMKPTVNVVLVNSPVDQ